MDNSTQSNTNIAHAEVPAHQTASQTRVRRRNRLITSCLECRRRKVKCDRLYPCTRCQRLSKDCVFHGLAPQQHRPSTIIEKSNLPGGSLQSHPVPEPIEFYGDNFLLQSSSTHLLDDEDSDSDDEGPVPEDEKNLEPTTLVRVDASYRNDVDDDMLDLGIKIGKMRMNERIGGLFRPGIHDELDVSLENSAADKRTEQEFLMTNPTLPDQGADFLAPGSAYIAPGDGFIWGSGTSYAKPSLFSFLPTRAAANLLVRKYYDNVHFIARVMHWPTFQLQHDNFWAWVQNGSEPPAWQQSLVFSVLFSAVASMTEEDVMTVFAKSRATVLDCFQTATEVALSKAHFLRLTKLETLQALVIYLIPMCRDQLSRAHSALVGMAVRLAECIGLHKDAADSDDVSPIECHVRRMVWFQLSFLDFRTCEAHGPRPSIKREDYTTKFPQNADDLDLLRRQSGMQKAASTTWTDMTCSRIRFECIEMQKVVWHDRLRVEKKKMTLTHCLSKIEAFREDMETKYGSIFDLTKPIQKYTRYMMTVLVQRMYVMILHTYLHNFGQKVPERLREMTIESGTQSMENAVALDRTPELAKWKWYNGAYQQWHIAFLLLSEIYIFPQRRQADRIWDILDFVFEADPAWSRAQKARTIIVTARDRAGIYRDMRRVRVPPSMEQGVDMKRHRKDGGSPEDLMSQEACNTISIFDVVSTSDTVDNGYPTLNQSQQVSGVQHSPPQLAEPSATTSSGSSPEYFNSPTDISENDVWSTFVNNEQIQWSEGFDAQMNSVLVSPNHASTFVDNTQVLSMSQPTKAFKPLPIASPKESNSVILDIDWLEWDKLFPPENSSSTLDITHDLSVQPSITQS